MSAPWRGVVLLVAVLSACGGGAAAPAITLDGSPRRSNAEGVVTAVTSEKLTLDGTRSFEIDERLRCFDSATLKSVSLISRQGTYVQAGVAGRRVDWIAGYSAVVEQPGKPRLAYHVGIVSSSKPGEVVFKDGSVLRLAPGVVPVPAGSQARAEIDVERHVVTVLALA